MVWRETRITMKSNIEPVQRDRGAANGAGMIRLIVAFFAIRSSRAAWQTASLSLGLTAVFLFVLTLPPTRPLSTGTEISEPLAIELDRLLQSKSFSGAVLI